LPPAYLFITRLRKPTAGYKSCRKKIAKGHLYPVTDSNVTLISSFSSYLACGAFIGALCLIAAGISSAADADNHLWLPGGGALILAGVGVLLPAVGIITGVVTVTSSRSKTLLIEGNMQKWHTVKTKLLKNR